MKSVDQTLDILEYIGFNQPVGVSDVSRGMNIPKTTCHRAIKALETAGWIEAGGPQNALWSLTLKALTIGSLAVNARGRLRAIAIPSMESLRRETEETVHLNLYRNHHTVLVERLDGIRTVTVFNPLGGTVTLHPTAAGRMLMAHFSEEDLDQYFASIPEGKYELTQVEIGKLTAKLPRFLEQGFAITVGGLHRSVVAVAAPIFADDNYPIGAVSVSAPNERMSEQLARERGRLVADIARQISLGLRL